MPEDILLTFDLLQKVESEMPVFALWNRGKFNRRHESLGAYDYPVQIVDGLRFTTGELAPPKAVNSLVVKIRPLGKRGLKEKWVRLDSLRLSKYRLPRCLKECSDRDLRNSNQRGHLSSSEALPLDVLVDDSQAASGL